MIAGLTAIRAFTCLALGVAILVTGEVSPYAIASVAFFLAATNFELLRRGHD